MEFAKARMWTAKAEFDRTGTPASHARMVALRKAAMVEARRWSTSPIGLQYVGAEADRRKWAFPKKFRVEVILAEENDRRRARAAALRAGAVEKQEWKANIGDKNERFGAHRALFPPTITSDQIDDLRREHATNPSVLVAITRNRKTSSSTLRALERHSNAEVQSCARLALERRSKHWAGSRAGRRARAAAAKAQAGSQGGTQDLQQAA